MSIGLSEVGSGDGDTLMNSFKTLINELAETCKLNEIDRNVKLIASLTNTLSDQGSVNPVFNSDLADLRSDLLPVVFDNWLDLSEESQLISGPWVIYFAKCTCLSILRQNATRP